MVFNSISFLIFFGIVCIICTLLRKKQTAKQIILLIASYVFYGWWNWKCMFLMLALTLVSYFCARRLDKTNNKTYLVVGVVFPLLILGVFKYFNFFVSSFAALFGIANAKTLSIILPVGISFYTFQSLSYTIDVYRKAIPCEKSFLKVALYIAFFPQLVAGPIVKANDFIPQLYEDRNISIKNIAVGVQWFVFGLFKKIVIADNISVCVDTVFSSPSNYSAISVIFAVIGYSIQIYCDFSGYSDMALGCAKCLGYDLMRNFNLPYISRNVSEFWKRWHISLSTWLHEYLYIPLGGNRKGNARTYINLFLTMLIGGLWHGASWTFVLWGGIHGIALCIHKVWMKLTKHDKHYKGSVFGRTISTIITYLFVSFCWIFFRAEDFSTAKAVISAIFTWQDGISYISTWTVLGIVCVLTATVAAYIKSRLNKTEFEGFYPTVNLNSVFGLTVFFVAVGLCIALMYTGGSPFIYFQF